MDGELLDQNKNEEKELKGEDDTILDETAVSFEDPQFLCGWRGFRPKCLQVFNNPKWFVFFISVFSCVQGLLVNGMTSICIPELEKEFGFSSKESGVILASNDAAGILLVGVVSYFGSHANKPKWIGLGSLITGVGAMLFAMPKLIVGRYSPADLQIDMSKRGLCLAGTNMTHIHSQCNGDKVDSSALSLMVFSIAQLIMGAGTTPLYTLGPAFLDENVSPKMSPVYLGIWFATTFFGPGLGYMTGGIFLSKYTDIKVPDGLNLTPRDPRWIGAWWLGFFSLSWFLLLTGFCLLGYPAAMPKSRVKRDEALEKGDLPGKDESLGTGWRGMIRSTVQLLKNKTFIFAVFAITVKTVYGVAIGSFFAKIVKVKFDATSTLVGVGMGLIMIPGMGGGIMIGSYIMKKIDVAQSAKKGALLCTVFGVLTMAFSVSWLIPGCNNAVYRGVNLPYANESSVSGFTGQCNSHCFCSKKIFNPVCAGDGSTFFSSCYAGCKGRIGRKAYGNCSCVAVEETNSTMTSTKVELGYCDRDCKNLYLFLAFIGLVVIMVFISATPHKMIVLRSVPDNQRAFALGIQFIIMRSLSFLPGPVIFGSVIDANCLVWQFDDCGKRLNCVDYKIDDLSRSTVYFGCTTSVMSAVFYFFSWWFYKPVETSGKTISQKELLEDEKQDQLVRTPSVQKLPGF